MKSCAIYRIAETLGVLLFMTLAIIIFNKDEAKAELKPEA